MALIRDRVSRLRRRFDVWQRDQLEPLIVAGRPMKDVRLLGTSRAGLLRWRAQYGGRPVKIFECFDEGHAELIQELCEQSMLRRYFPRCLLRESAFLVVDWVEGAPRPWPEMARDPASLAQVARIQAQLHELVPPRSPGGYEYLAHLERRWQRYGAMFPVGEAHARCREALAAPPPVPPRCSHADLTAMNIVWTPQGAPVLIDNELLGASSYYPADLFNSVRSMGRRDRDAIAPAYVRAYREAGGSLELLAAHAAFFAALWHLREIGALLQSGAIAEAVRMSRDYVAAATPRHPLDNLVTA